VADFSPRIEDDRRPVARREGDVAAGNALRCRSGDSKLTEAEDLAKHDPHLELGKCSAETTTDAAAEGNPGVRRG
jgi:hypothetical protein